MKTRAPDGANRPVVGPQLVADDNQLKMRHVVARLTAIYGAPVNEPDGDALAGLVATILSQHTSDSNSSRAYQSLRAAFPHWRAILQATDEELTAAIRVGGLARVKARRIKEVLAGIVAARGAFDLAFLADLPLDEARGWLQALPGVGPKTAACTLLFNLGRPALPVDTHVHRVARRLGLLGPRVNAGAAHAALETLLAPDEIYPFHVNMILHGRRICKAPLPRCGLCLLTDLCAYYQGTPGHRRDESEPNRGKRAE